MKEEVKREKKIKRRHGRRSESGGRRKVKERKEGRKAKDGEKRGKEGGKKVYIKEGRREGGKQRIGEKKGKERKKRWGGRGGEIVLHNYSFLGASYQLD